VLSYSEALREALEHALTRDPRVFILGQGVDDPHSMFGCTRGLRRRFGPERVFDTPLSEDAMTGVCIGAAMQGMRPVYFHNRPDFLLLAFNQIVTHASKMRYMDRGETTVPMVIWSAIGRGWGSGAQHSQAIQGMLMGVPGLRILMPSTPADAKGLMLSAIADDNPVLIFEHRWCMRQKGEVSEAPYLIPFGKAVYRRMGSDLTIAGASHMVEIAASALDALSGEGVTADLIDLRTLRPWDEETVVESVCRTGRLLVLDTGWEVAGVCAEIGFRVSELAFAHLKGPVRRVALPDVPCPAGAVLEKLYYPDAERVASVVREMCLGA
jgi:pyruvate dehydrogenase E1 component beta subunit